MSSKKRSRPAAVPVELDEGGEQPIGSVGEVRLVAAEPEAELDDAAEVRVKPEAASVTLPIGRPPAGGYRGRHVELNNMTGRQRDALRCVFEGARRDAAVLANGKFVQTAADAVRLVLERVADAAGL